MKIGCDNFNYNLLKNDLQVTLIENFGVCNDVFDVVCATWKQIHSYIRHNESKIESTLFVVSQYSDTTHNRRIGGMIDYYNQQYHTNNKLVMIGDGIADWPNHISTPWSHFFWNEKDCITDRTQGTHWTCLMSKSRPHRDTVSSYIARNIDLFDMPNDFVYDQTQDLQLIPYMFREVIPEHNYYKNFPQWLTVKHPRFHTDGDLIAPYHRSRIELVAETVTDFFFVTEKTVKPIRAGIPFVVVGSVNFLRTLRKLGFKTFAPWIDESYDAEPDEHKRIIKCCDAFRDFVLNSPVTQQDLHDVCYHNQQRLKQIQQLEPNFWQRQVQKIKQQVRQYGKTQLHHTNKYTDGS